MLTCAIGRWFATGTLLVTALPFAVLGREARAFSGFFVSGDDARRTNSATHVFLMREGQRTVESMQPSYEGPPQDFAVVVPVPVVLQKENVKTLSRDVFDRVDELSSPHLVEYWEQDPCAPRPLQNLPQLSAGGPPPSTMTMTRQGASPVVKVESQFAVGEYDIVVLSATDSTDLESWLRDHHYKIPAGAETYLRPYVELGMKFFVANVDATKLRFQRVGNGPEQAILSPLRFHYDSDSFTLPIRLGLINSSGTQDLVVTILAPGQRFEVANYDNIAIPTNFDVTDAARQRFGSFYAALFDETIRQYPHAFVTEYAWGPPLLQPEDLLTLGADVLPSSPPPRPASSRPAKPIGLPEPWIHFVRRFVLTRLHARYTKDAVGDDLVFRAAPPIGWVPEFAQDWPWFNAGRPMKLEQGAQNNNFQASYGIRHPWTGPIACKDPYRGEWGDPPGHQAGSGKPPPVKLASKIGFVPRTGALELAAFVRGELPHAMVLSLTPPLAVLVAATSPPAADTSRAHTSEVADASSVLPQPPAISPRPGGCAGCRVATDDSGAIVAMATIGVVTFLRFRRWRG